MLVLYLCSALFLAVQVNSIPKTRSEESSSNKYYLPETSIPHDYLLRFYANPYSKHGYNGTVDINITVTENLKELVLHSYKLRIDVKHSFLLKNNGENRVRVTSITEDKATRFIRIYLTEQINPGNYNLHLAFTGDYYTYANGLFLNSYEENGKEEYMLATHFEPVGARDMFPCYDEPNLKATFKVEVTHPKSFSAFSNMPVEQIRSSSEETTTTVFQRTPKMSTYLLALAVAKYKTKMFSVNGKTYSIHVQPGKLNNTNFALKTSLSSVKHFQQLLKVNYTLPKLDGVVVPLFGGGMENWGLIVYGKSIIVPDSVSKSPNLNRGVVNLIAHEIAHQWFGDLVTLDWWDYVWLNEGFATYYAPRIADLIYPSERFMDYHVLKLLRVLKSDSQSKDSESINRPVDAPEDIHPKFNSISYDKASSIIRFMSMSFIGFDEGITHYLKMNSLQNSVPDDLFESLNKFTKLSNDLTIGRIMKGWSSNRGYPLLTVNVIKRSDRAYVTVSQKIFLKDSSSTNEKWWIPITYATESRPVFKNLIPKLWLSDEKANDTLQLDPFDGWIIMNLQKAAHMRVNYDIDNWKRIIAFLKGPNFRKIHYLNRMQLIDDSKELADVKLIPQSIVLELLTYLKQEDDDIVASAGRSIFKYYARLLRDTKVFPKFEAYLENIVGKEKTKEIINVKNLEEMATVALSTYGIRHMTVSTVFDEVVESLYDDNSFNIVRNVVEKNRKLNSVEQLNFLRDVRRYFENNKNAKDSFLKNNYKDVENWLTSNY